MKNIGGTVIGILVRNDKTQKCKYSKQNKQTKYFKTINKWRLFIGIITIFLLLFIPLKYFFIDNNGTSNSFFSETNPDIINDDNLKFHLDKKMQLDSRGNIGDNKIDDKIINKLDKSVLWSFATGLRGEISTDVLQADLDNDGNDDSLIIGTSLGVIILNIANGELIKNIKAKSLVTSIAVLKDVNSNGYQDIAYSTIANRENNILVIDSFTGDELWGYKPTTKVYTDNLGWEELGTKTWCVKAIGGDNENNLDNLVVSSWKSVLKLDGRTGDKIWEFKGTDDVWSLTVVEDLTGDGSKDVIAASQEGYLYLINGQTGKNVWQIKLTKSYTKKLQMGPAAIDYTIDRSVWSAEIIHDINADDINDLIVGAEDGFTYAISGAKGEIIWKAKCLKLSKPNDETGYGDRNFFNLQVQVIDDVDSDGFRDVISFARSERGQNSMIVLSSGPSMVQYKENDFDGDSKLLDTRAGEGQDKTMDNDVVDDVDDVDDVELREILKIDNINNNGYGGVTQVAVGDDVSGDGINEVITIMNRALVALDLTKGDISHIYMEHDLFEISTEGIQLLWIDDFTDDNKDELLIKFGDQGVLLIDLQNREILWDFSNSGNFEIKKFDDVTSDGVEELLLILPANRKKDFGYDNNHDNNKMYNLIRAFYLINKINGEILWQYSVPLNNVSSTGFHYYEIVADMTGDDVFDIIGFTQDKEDLNYTLVKLLDGKSGEITWSKPPSNNIYRNPNLTPEDGLYEKSNLINHRIRTITKVADQTGDGISDILVGGEESKLYLLDGLNGTQHWELTNNWEDYSQGGQEVWFESWVDYSGVTGPKPDKDSGSDYSYQWESDLDGFLSSDSSFNGVISIGDHTITLQVDDGLGNFGTDLIFVSAKPSHQPVFKIKDNNHYKYLASELTNIWLEPRNFDGSRANIEWESDLDGYLSSGQNLQTYLTPGEHKISVRVTDYDNNLGEVEEVFNVLIYEPRDLRVNFRLDNFEWYDIPAYTDVTFNSELDYDGDWNSLDYNWYIDGKIDSSSDILHRTFDPGIYDITLEVTDTHTDYLDSMTRNIAVHEKQSQRIKFSITDSYDEWTINNDQDEFYSTSPSYGYNNLLKFQIWSENFDDASINYTLDVGDGTIVYNDYFEHNYSTTGEYDVIATVKDSKGNSDSTRMKLKILSLGEPVSRWALDNGGWCWVGDVVNLDGSGSFDLDGSISTYHWDLGDGTTDDDDKITHTYQSEGSYTITCTIQDNHGKITSLSRAIKVYSIGKFIADMNILVNGEQRWMDDSTVPLKVFTEDSITIESSLRNFQGEKNQRFDWYFDDKSIGESQSIILPHPLIKGTHEVVLHVEDSNGYSDSLTYGILVRDSGELSVSINQPNNGDVCVGSEISGTQTQIIDWLPWTCNAFMIGDDELLLYGDGRLMVANINENGVSSEYTWMYPPHDDEIWIDDNQVMILQDQNGDEIMDILCWLGTHDGGYYEMLSGSNGEKLQFDTSNYFSSMDQNENNFVYGDYYSKNDIFIEDFNRDQVDDAIIIKPDYDSNKISLSVLDGNTGTIIWEENELFDDVDDLWSYQSNIPATIISDQNDDGIDEVIIGTTRTESEGADLRIYDGSSGKKLETITYEEQSVNEDWVKTVPVKKITEINDFTGDGTKDIVLIRSAGTSKESFDRQRSVLEIVDLAEGKIVRRFETENAEIINNEDITTDQLADVILIIDGTVYCLNGGFNVKILSPSTKELSNERFKLKWDKPDLVCEVKVDGISYGYFNGGETELTLSGGRHVIQVLATDEFGGVVADSITVNVPISNLPWLINILALTLLISYITVRTAVPYIRRKQRKRSIMEEIEKIKRLKEKRSEKVDQKSIPRLPIPALPNPTYVPSVTPTMDKEPESKINVESSLEENKENAIQADSKIYSTKILNDKQFCDNTNENDKENDNDNRSIGLEERFEMYRTALEIAYGDGIITEAEENLLLFLREKYGITMDEHRILETEFTCSDN